MNYFWLQYDKLNEPIRFLVAMAMLSPIWIMNIHPNIGTISISVFACLIGLSRIIYIKNKEKGSKKK